MPEAEFWTCEQDAEHLIHTDIDEAVQEWADMEEGPLPETVTVYGYAPIQGPPASFWAGHPLEGILDALDEDYGSPEEATEPTEGMLAAEDAFRAAVLAEYKVWRCEQVDQREVRVRDYINPEEADHGN